MPPYTPFEFDTAVDPYAVAEAMREQGGSFVRSLAVAWANADPTNKERIEATWPELFRQYREMVEKQA